MKEKVSDESLYAAVMKVLANPRLRIRGIRCIASIFYHFFFRQYKAALLPGRIPVSWVDHPLDALIPFIPQRVAVYLDFIAFWVRMIGFILRVQGRRGIKSVGNFIDAIGRLYAFAAQVYAQNLSTTHRPRYFARPRFLLIHGTDPHLMCIPSLHVMVVILTYTQFRAMIHALGEREGFAPQIEEVRQGALAITEAVLYVKQHSVNCVAAAMYAMTRFDPALFPPEEAERFVSQLFIREKTPNPRDRQLIARYILERYTGFLEEGHGAPSWETPLLTFLGSP